MDKTVAWMCLVISWTSTVSADKSLVRLHDYNSPNFQTSFQTSLDRRARQLGDPPPVPNPFIARPIHDALSTVNPPSSSFSNIDFGSSGSFNSFTIHPTVDLLAQPSQRQPVFRQPRKTINTGFEKLVAFRTSESQQRTARQQRPPPPPPPPPGPNGIDYSQAKRTTDGRLCVIQESMVETITKDPIMKCTMKNVEMCPYTYDIEFKPAQEEICEEMFESKCQITFKQEPSTEMIKKCTMPIQQKCSGQGNHKCQTMYETSCSTRYVEKAKGKYVGDTTCERMPIEMCGSGCAAIEQKEECREEEITTMIEEPHMDCGLSPQKICHMVTKMVPNLTPKPKCSTVPKETCALEFSSPRVEMKRLQSEFCLDESPAAKGQTYEDFNALAEPLGSS